MNVVELDLERQQRAKELDTAARFRDCLRDMISVCPGETIEEKLNVFFHFVAAAANRPLAVRVCPPPDPGPTH